VDRDGDREQDEIFLVITERHGEGYGIAEVSADFCLSKTEVHVEAEPLGENPYHATIYRSEECEQPPPTSQARKQAKQCTMQRRPNGESGQ